MSFFCCWLSASPFSDEPDARLTGAGGPEADLAPPVAEGAAVPWLSDAAEVEPDFVELVEAVVGVGLVVLPGEVEVAVDLAGVEVAVDLAGGEGPGTVLAEVVGAAVDFVTFGFVGPGLTVLEGVAGVSEVGAGCFLRGASAMMKY